MSIVNRLMAKIQEIDETIVAVGKIEFQKDFKARWLHELDQDKTRKEAALILAKLKEGSADKCQNE